MGPAKPKILCVDDEPVNLKLYDAVLLPQGFEVLHAADGARALEIARNESVDLMLLDVMLPGMNGFDVCRQLKDDRGLLSLPVVMITSLQDHRARTQGIEAGADDFISKPIDQDEVLARIRMLLKVRDLNERLGRSLASVAELTRFAKESAEDFEPAEFELMSRVDRLVDRVIREGGAVPDRPQLMIVGVRENAGWAWRQYESPFKELLRHELEPGGERLLSLPGPGQSISFHARRGEFTSRGLDGFVARLEEQPQLAAQLRDLLAFLSDGLCVFAANFDRDVRDDDATILDILAAEIISLQRLAELARRNEEDTARTVAALLRAAALHGGRDEGHPRRVGEYSALLARQLGLGERFVATIRLQAQLHDVGNLGIPHDVLMKKGTPDFREWEAIRAHTRLGAEIIGNHPRLAMAMGIALSHHENWDGSGYPNWLQGEQIPLAARIAALADRYDALRVARPYKPAMSHDAASAVILQGSDRVRPEHFDPTVLRAFQELAPRFAEVFADMQTPSRERRVG